MTVIELLKHFGIEITVIKTLQGGYIENIDTTNVVVRLLDKEVSIIGGSFYTGARDPNVPEFDEDEDCWYI